MYYAIGLCIFNSFLQGDLFIIQLYLKIIWVKRTVELINVKAYRITHIENIPHILLNGITHKDSRNRNPEYREIGDICLINTRNERTVTVDNGNPEQVDGSVSIIPGHFIPFYFGVKMPMLYVAQHGGNFVENATPASDIIYMACSVTGIIAADFDFFFTDGHATDKLTSVYDRSKINELVRIIDWDAVKSSYWGGNENLNIKRKKQAEFLVRGDLSPELIIGFGCYDETARNRLIKFGIDNDKIKVIPKAYF